MSRHRKRFTLHEVLDDYDKAEALERVFAEIEEKRAPQSPAIAFDFRAKVGTAGKLLPQDSPTNRQTADCPAA
jgi:hypothetical protein